jgi:hypothetical protein
MPVLARTSAGLSTIAALFAVSVVGFAPTSSDATTKGSAKNVCEQEVLENYGAKSVENIKAHKANVYYVVYGDMDRGDGQQRHFRCHVTHDQVDYVQIWHPYDEKWHFAEPVSEGPASPAPKKKPVAQPIEPAHPQTIAVEWGPSYSPAEDIKCYKKRGACFDANGDLDISWTHKEFPG